MKKIIVAMVLLTNGTIAAAEGPTTIWSHYKAGMTKAEVKAIYERVTPITAECSAVVYPGYESGKLSRIDLEYAIKGTTGTRCADVISESLVAKYGEPHATEREMKLNDCGNPYASGLAGALAGLCEAMTGDEPARYTYRRWINDGIEITLKRDASSETIWWLAYRPAVKADVKAKL